VGDCFLQGMHMYMCMCVKSWNAARSGYVGVWRGGGGELRGCHQEMGHGCESRKWSGSPRHSACVLRSRQAAAWSAMDMNFAQTTSLMSYSSKEVLKCF
jgi:hypothetical protein